MSNSPVPGWAAFFTPDRYQNFVATLRKVLGELLGDYSLNLTDGSYRRPGNAGVYGIVNMAQVCNQAPFEDWEGHIRTYVNATIHPSEDIGPTDFEEARPMLRVRLFPREGIDAKVLVTQEVSPTFHTCLALDLPDRVMSVKPELVEAWGIPTDELFEIGRQNVLATANPERQDFPSPDGAANASIFSGGDFFVASLALTLDDVLGPAGEYGRFVAVPNRHVVLTAGIESGASLISLSFVVPNARQMFQQGPGSISPYTYWVSRDGTWTTLDIDLTPRGVAVRGPDEFVQRVMQPLQQ